MSHKAQESGVGPVSGPAAPSDAPALNRSVIDELRALQEDGEPDILQELVDLFMNDAPAKISSVREAVARSDVSTLRQVTHSLKGSSANLGAIRLAAACAQLELLARDGRVTPDNSVLVTLIEREFQVLRGELAKLGVKA